VSRPAIISNLQSVLVQNLLPESRIMLLLASWVPPAAVCIHVARKYCASSMSDDVVPVYLPRVTLAGLEVCLIVNIDHPRHHFSSSLNIGHNHIVVRTTAQVCLFISCKDAPRAHCHPNILRFSNLVRQMDDSNSAYLPWWLLQSYHICYPFHSHLHRCHGPFIRPGAVVLDCSDHWKLGRAFRSPLQSRS